KATAGPRGDAVRPVTWVEPEVRAPIVRPDHAEPFHTRPMNDSGSAAPSRSEGAKSNVALQVAPAALAEASVQTRFAERSGLIVEVARFGWSPAAVLAVRLMPAPAPEPETVIGADVAAS